MIASYNDGEITFYEELGITPQASPEEIRDAFRLCVRLVHPDQQTDPQLKAIAEKQMRKLNRIYAVLSDPDSRLRYDEILDPGFAPDYVLNSPPPGLRRLGARLAWCAAIVVSAGGLIWLASDNTPVVQGHTPDLSGTLASTSLPALASPGKAKAEPASEGSRIAQLQSDLQAVLIERDAAIRELDRLRRTPENRNRQLPQSTRSWPLEGSEPKPALTITELPSTPKLPALVNPAIPRIDRPANRQLAGFWFYAKPSEGQTNKNQSLYVPEYIEANITEDNGLIHGRYRSRFLIADRAIQPDVNFAFTGTRAGSQCNCQWTGAGGAKGDLVLKLTSENSIRIDWTASELGTQQGLSAGTAVLTRRIE